MLRAQYVFAEDSGWYAVFADDVQPNQLNGIVERLQRLPGVTAQTAQKNLTTDPQDVPKTVISMRVERSSSSFRAVQLLKELTNPIVPITVKSLTLIFVYCPCRHKSVTGHIRFLEGFGPEMATAFRKQYMRAVVASNLLPLWETEPQPQSDAILAKITKIFAELNAIVEEIILEGSTNPDYCSLRSLHQKS